MSLELNASTVEWILKRMESLTKDVMYGNYTNEYKIELRGKFSGLLEILDNSDYESYGLKFKLELPTKKEYDEQQNNLRVEQS